ncbi:serine/threonine-protein kinase pim-1-like [Archocentrus centrarchus]|uniref:serine/threonine-protein kinase pim-1-like n=1 Tax=Archocentrus centrarchus TaxID=63155 RepID=UPI0011EA3E2F|nr:serine/threonine-protein kinase pim-1-like [Archocentrus centrarchus]
MVRGQKRKFPDDDDRSSRPAKKIKLFHHVHNDEEQASSSVETSKVSSSKNLEGCSDEKEKMCTRNGKRKATDDGNVPPVHKKKRLDQEETKGGTKNSVGEQRCEFQAKYVEQEELRGGQCGKVFAGYRKEDKFPVTIKHIPKRNVPFKVKDENGKRISVEVAVMLKFAAQTPGSGGTSAVVSLLDWFDLRKELILVMERPVPAVDLKQYIKENGGILAEETAKVILKQLIEAAKELEDKNIFHRDINIENILIETGSDVPRVRLMNFGISCFFKKRSFYSVFCGTLCYSPPEWFMGQCYRPGPTTVWQLGAVLYETLHPGLFFDTGLALNDLLEISEELSENCQDFLKMCLDLDPKRRPILKDLLLHRWFR